MISLSHVRKVYMVANFLALALFAFHAFVLVETAHLLQELNIPLVQFMGLHISDTLLLLSAFFVLYCTHVLEAVVWGLFFIKIGEFRTLNDAVYFTGTSLTTLGFGDVTLKHPWQRLGPVMATNGILLYGCSTAFLFLVIHKVLLTSLSN